jgi:undecaprenyl diphosphate synthase
VQQPARLPEHLAVVMDGNSRWAHRERRPRREGHWAGVDALRNLVDGLLELEHVTTLTVYAMSIENLLRRPPAEVAWLLELFDQVLSDEAERLRSLGVQLRFVGKLELLPEPLRARLLKAAAATPEGPQRLLLCIAISYGGREEVARTAQTIAARVAAGELAPEQVDEELFTATLHASERSVPSDPDLLIRTGGALRLSNFLLYQCAYTELVSLECLWPDFGEQELAHALDEYAQRTRNFGGRPAAQAGPKAVSGAPIQGRTSH